MTQVVINERKDLKILKEAIFVCLDAKSLHSVRPKLEDISAFKLAFGKYPQN